MSRSALDRIYKGDADVFDAKVYGNVIEPGRTVVGSGVSEVDYEVSFTGTLQSLHTLSGEVAKDEEIDGRYLVLTDGSIIKLAVE